MKLAEQHLRNRGWTKIEDVSKSQPYDFHCSKDDEALRVEVKGTTSQGRSIILTPNEVSHTDSHFPHTALVVVHSIEITHDGEPSGGLLRFFEPWEVDDSVLRPLAFSYSLPE